MITLLNGPHGLGQRTLNGEGFCISDNALSFVAKMVRARKSKTSRKCSVANCCTISPSKPPRYAVLGAGFAGISVAWHLLQHCSKVSPICIEIYDEVGIGGGASGISGGLLHPYSPKGKLIWKGAECWEEALKLLTVAEAAINTANKENNLAEPIVWRRGILRPATTAKNVDEMKKSIQVSIGSCKISCIDGTKAKELVPELIIPSDFALYMPQAVNIHPERYLKAMFKACQKEAKDLSASGYSETQVSLYRRNISSLLEFSGDYDAVICCLGAKANLLPELAGKLPISTHRGVVAHLELPSHEIKEYKNEAPSILSSAWLAVQGSHRMLIGSTRERGSSDYSSDTSVREASLAVEELISKTSMVYPMIRQWLVLGTRAGVRAMPPRTSLGALPLVGCVDDFILGSMQKKEYFEKQTHYSSQRKIPKYWFVGGLGSRGLIYHGWLGKMVAEAVVFGNEAALPRELTSWKLSKPKCSAGNS